MIELLAAMIAGVAVFATFQARAPRDPQVRRRVAELGTRPDIARTRPSRVSTLLERIGRRLPIDRESTRRLAAAAALPWSADALAGMSAVGATAGFLVGLSFDTFSVIAAPALGLAGFKAPFVWASGHLKARREEVRAHLPEAVDLLAVCTQAGLNIALSLRRVAARTPGVLGDELRRADHQIELGLPRQQALDEFAARTGIEEARSLVAALASAERFGTKVAASLNTFAADLRLQRRRQIEEQARRAPVKILFPLVFLILPAFLLLTVVPLVLGTFRTLGL